MYKCLILFQTVVEILEEERIHMLVSLGLVIVKKEKTLPEKKCAKRLFFQGWREKRGEERSAADDGPKRSGSDDLVLRVEQWRKSQGAASTFYFSLISNDISKFAAFEECALFLHANIL